MADTDEAEEQPQRVFCALPELHDPQSTAITVEVDTLLQTIMEMSQVTFPQRMAELMASE